MISALQNTQTFAPDMNVLDPPGILDPQTTVCRTDKIVPAPIRQFEGTIPQNQGRIFW
jgi:hypothetical protein